MQGRQTISEKATHVIPAAAGRSVATTAVKVEESEDMDESQMEEMAI